MAKARREQSDKNHYWAQENISCFFDPIKNKSLERNLCQYLEEQLGPIKSFYDAHTHRQLFTHHKLEESLKTNAKSKELLSNDRALTLREIRKLVEYLDRGIKLNLMLCLLEDSDQGLGIIRDRNMYVSYNYNNNDEGEVLAAKLIVYAGES